MWGRLSPHPALETEGGRRVRPTRVAPLAIFLREDALRLLPPASNQMPLLSHPARDVFVALEQRGALFFNELLRATGRLASEVEDGLWELVAAGLVTADGFENLRALIDPKRRKGEGRGRGGRPRHAAGRWALLQRSSEAVDVEFFANQLLSRWGVVFRDVLARENPGSGVARSAAGLPAHGSSRRDSRRPLRFRILGRTVHAARGSRSTAASAADCQDRRSSGDRSRRSAQSFRNRAPRSAYWSAHAGAAALAGWRSASCRVLFFLAPGRAGSPDSHQLGVEVATEWTGTDLRRTPRKVS